MIVKADIPGINMSEMHVIDILTSISCWNSNKIRLRFRGNFAIRNIIADMFLTMV